MSDKKLTFEEVNKHIEAANLTALEKASANTAVAGATAASISGQVCAAYKVIKPILQLIVGTPFIPAKWKTALTIFMNFMNVLCP
jgi:hypothetical protein